MIGHRFDYNTPIEETVSFAYKDDSFANTLVSPPSQMQALHDVVKAGYVRYIGMSSCHAYQCKSRLLFFPCVSLTILRQFMLCKVSPRLPHCCLYTLSTSNQITLFRTSLPPSFLCKITTVWYIARKKGKCIPLSRSVWFFFVPLKTLLSCLSFLVLVLSLGLLLLVVSLLGHWVGTLLEIKPIGEYYFKSSSVSIRYLYTLIIYRFLKNYQGGATDDVINR